MEVILIDDVESLGERGEKVTVKDGYARNYLIPRGLALQATTGNVRYWESEQKLSHLREKKARKEAATTKAALEKLELSFASKAGEDDKLFGSVTNQDVAALLAAQGHAVDKKRIHLEEPIRALGVYKVPVKVYRDVVAEVKLWVVREAEAV